MQNASSGCLVIRFDRPNIALLHSEQTSHRKKKNITINVYCCSLNVCVQVVNIRCHFYTLRILAFWDRNSGVRSKRSFDSPY